MSSVRHEAFVVTVGAWLLASLVVMVLLGTLTLQGYFILAFIGLLSAMQLHAPTEPGDRWWLPLRGLVVACFAVFGYVVYLRVLPVI